MAKVKDRKLNDLLITGDQSYASIDHSVGRLVLDQKSHSAGWFKWLIAGVLGTGLLGVSIGWLVFQGIGIRHQQLRLVDRDRTRRDADFGNFAPTSSAMA
jgi:hypothetical protein